MLRFVSIAALAITFAACRECTLTPAKNMCIAPQPALLPSDVAGYGQQQVASCMAPAAADAMFDILADVLAEDQRVGREEFVDTLRRRPPEIEWVASDLRCGSIRAAGCTHGDWLQVLVSNCVAHTALAHELVHVYLMRSGDPTGDPEHKLPIWESESRWLVRGHQELCEH